MPHFENDIAPGANYMDRKRCYSIYYYTPNDCCECSHRKKCQEQLIKEVV